MCCHGTSKSQQDRWLTILAIDLGCLVLVMTHLVKLSASSGLGRLWCGGLARRLGPDHMTLKSAICSTRVPTWLDAARGDAPDVRCGRWCLGNTSWAPYPADELVWIVILPISPGLIQRAAVRRLTNINHMQISSCVLVMHHQQPLCARTPTHHTALMAAAQETSAVPMVQAVGCCILQEPGNA